MVGVTSTLRLLTGNQGFLVIQILRCHSDLKTPLNGAVISSMTSRAMMAADHRMINRLLR